LQRIYEDATFFIVVRWIQFLQAKAGKICKVFFMFFFALICATIIYYLTSKLIYNYHYDCNESHKQSVTCIKNFINAIFATVNICSFVIGLFTACQNCIKFSANARFSDTSYSKKNV